MCVKHEITTSGIQISTYEYNNIITEATLTQEGIITQIQL